MSLVRVAVIHQHESSIHCHLRHCIRKIAVCAFGSHLPHAPSCLRKSFPIRFWNKYRVISKGFHLAFTLGNWFTSEAQLRSAAANGDWRWTRSRPLMLLSAAPPF